MMRVLIVDDQKLLRESFKLALENQKDIIVVGCASNGKEAVTCCEQLKPDVVLMDISMPVCNGIESTKLIKSRFPTIKILMLTASNDEIDVTEALRNGADGYLSKDVGTEELMLSIKSTALGLGIIQRNILDTVTIGNPKTNKSISNKSIVLDGIEITLTEKQIKVIEMVVDGYDNKQIGSALFFAEGTVKNIISDIISKLQLKDRTQLAVFAIKNNLV